MATALRVTTWECIDSSSKRTVAQDEHQDVAGSELKTENGSRMKENMTQDKPTGGTHDLEKKRGRCIQQTPP